MAYSAYLTENDICLLASSKFFRDNFLATACIHSKFLDVTTTTTKLYNHCGYEDTELVCMLLTPFLCRETLN